MSNHEVGRLLKVSEVAELLGMKESGIRRWISVRKLPAVRLGRMVRIPADAVRRLIEANLRPAREAR